MPQDTAPGGQRPLPPQEFEARRQRADGYERESRARIQPSREFQERFPDRALGDFRPRDPQESLAYDFGQDIADATRRVDTNHDRRPDTHEQNIDEAYSIQAGIRNAQNQGYFQDSAADRNRKIVEGIRRENRGWDPQEVRDLAHEAENILANRGNFVRGEGPRGDRNR